MRLVPVDDFDDIFLDFSQIALQIGFVNPTDDVGGAETDARFLVVESFAKRPQGLLPRFENEAAAEIPADLIVEFGEVPGGVFELFRGEPDVQFERGLFPRLTGEAQARRLAEELQDRGTGGRHGNTGYVTRDDSCCRVYSIRTIRDLSRNPRGFSRNTGKHWFPGTAHQAEHGIEGHTAEAEQREAP